MSKNIKANREVVITENTAKSHSKKKDSPRHREESLEMKYGKFSYFTLTVHLAIRFQLRVSKMSPTPLPSVEIASALTL